MATVRMRCPIGTCDGDIVLAAQDREEGRSRFLVGRCSICARMWRLIAGVPEPFDEEGVGFG